MKAASKTMPGIPLNDVLSTLVEQINTLSTQIARHGSCQPV